MVLTSGLYLEKNDSAASAVQRHVADDQCVHCNKQVLISAYCFAGSLIAQQIGCAAAVHIPQNM